MVSGKQIGTGLSLWQGFYLVLIKCSKYDNSNQFKTCRYTKG